MALYGCTFWLKRAAVLCTGLALLPLHLSHAQVDPEDGTFIYSGEEGMDSVLGQIALFLMDQNRQEGNTFISQDIKQGIVGYQLRYFDNGNRLVDIGDWLSVRRYRIPAEPDTTRPEGYYKGDYMEFVDVDLDGINAKDYYFIEGRRFDLHGQSADILSQYQVQIESGISAFVRKVSYQNIASDLGARSQTAIKKNEAYEDGSLPSQMVFGIDHQFVFRPIVRSGTQLTEKEMLEEIRQRIGFVFSATTGYTDINGYRFRDIADQIALVQRTYDPSEAPTLTLIMKALFDTDGDGIITQENISNGYTRFRELHQQLTENARAQNRRIILPNEKLARLRQEYQLVHKKPFETIGFAQ